jgi:hypothetical protein
MRTCKLQEWWMTMWPIVGNGNSGQCSEFSVQSQFYLTV